MAMNAGNPGIRLRPLAIGDVLDETFRVYRRQFRAFVIVMGAVAVPVGIISALLQVAVGTLSTRIQNDPTSLTTIAGIMAGLLFIVVGLVGSLARVVAAAAAVRITANTILGQPIDVGEAYREAFGHLGTILWASFLTGLATFALVMTCIGIPFAVYVGLGWMLVIPCIMLEMLGARPALGRSWNLVRLHRWRLFIVSFLMGLITLLLVSIPTGLFGFVAGILVVVSGNNPTVATLTQVGNTVLGAVGETLFGAIGYITLTLLYYDLRVRKEAFDLQQRLPDAGPTAYVAPPPSPPTAHPTIPPPPMAPPDQR